MPESVITANRLTDGVVAWLDAVGGWTSDLRAATVFNGEAIQSTLEKVRERDSDVAVDIREIPVDVVEGSPVPQARRERLRGAGPSVRDDLAGASVEDRWAHPPFPAPPSVTSTSPYAGIYRYDEYDRQFLRDRAKQFRQQVKRRLSGELNEEEFKPLRLMNGLYLRSTVTCCELHYPTVF